MGRQPLLPHCSQNTLYEEHPGARAPSLTPNSQILAGIGPLGYAQMGPEENQ